MPFFLEIDHILSSVPLGEKYVMLSEFNSRLGSREHVEDQWDAVRGSHVYGFINDAGKEIISFSVYQANLCNTWFRKKAIHQGTLQYPK